MSDPKGHMAAVGVSGEVTLPLTVQGALGVQAGDTVVFSVEGNAVRVRSPRSVQHEIQTKYAGPHFSGMVDERSAERRAEAERE